MNNIDYEAIIQRLREMRLPAMAETMIELIENNELVTLSNEALLERLTSNELMSRKNNTIAKLKKKAHFSQPNANVTDLDHSPDRQINEDVLKQLLTNDYIKKHRNIIVLGACGTGKSYLINALGNHACDSMYSVIYCRLFEFLSEVNTESLISNEALKTIQKYAKPDVLIIDDFLISKINSKESYYIFQLLDYRYGKKSTIISSQLEPKEWHRNLGGTILSDSILDRIVSNSYRMILSGDSLRQSKEP